MLGAGAAAGQPQQELETGKPSEIVFPPPKILEVKATDSRLTVRFRELGLERVVGYRLYVFASGKWRLLAGTGHSPVVAEGCKRESTQYGLAAVDESRVEGERRVFTAILACGADGGR
jgi:hypothetical protein